MSALEELIPFLAEEAVKIARARILQAGRSVVEAVDGRLIETFPDGSFKLIRFLPKQTPVVPGTRLIRNAK